MQNQDVTSRIYLFNFLNSRVDGDAAITTDNNEDGRDTAAINGSNIDTPQSRRGLRSRDQ